MFNKFVQEQTSGEFETVIGPSVKVKGDFNSQGNIVVEGVVDGNLKTSGNLEVGNKALITASVEAKEAKIGGQINGNIKVAGYLEITATAKIYGDIETSAISIERGAMFNGKCVMSSANHAEGKKRSEKEN